MLDASLHATFAGSPQVAQGVILVQIKTVNSFVDLPKMFVHLVPE